MTRIPVTCGNCGGSGHITIFRTISEDKETGVCESRFDEVDCEQCGGAGYVKYAAFSIEEAEVIMKHCGLTWED
jgi:hypothetical protein